MAMFTKQKEKICELKNHYCAFQIERHNNVFFFHKNDFFSNFRSDSKDFALKQIEGVGLSKSACREIAVSFSNDS